MLNIGMYDIIQNNFKEIQAVKDCHLCGPIKKKMFHNTSFQLFIEKCFCHDCVWYDEDLERITKMKNFDLGS